MANRGLLVAFCLMVSGCMTSIGNHDEAAFSAMDFGPPQTVKLCVLLDENASRVRAQQLLDSWNEEAARYSLYVQPVSWQRKPRSGFFASDIMKDLESIPLEAPCDRLIYFVSRKPLDVAYGLAALPTGMPEVLGRVDGQTLTRGFVYADVAMPAHLISSPASTTRHELYHLLGCGQHHAMTRCYEQIKLLKEAAAADNNGFFPTYEDRGGILLTSREEVNAKLGSVAEPQALSMIVR